MKTSELRKSGIPLAGVLGLMVMLAGCGEKKQEAAQPATQAEKPAAVAQKPAGEKTDSVMPDEGDPASYLFDTMKSFGGQLDLASLKDRTGWKHVKEDVIDYAFAGDAVFQNNRITAVTRKGAKGVEVYARTVRGPEYRAQLAPRGGTGISDIKIAENSTSGVRLDVTFKGAERNLKMGVRVIPTEFNVEAHTAENMTALAVETKTRLAIVPNFFADDMVFHAGSLDADRILLPMEQFFLCPVEGGNSIMMCVCESDQAEAAVVFRGAGAQKIMTGAEIQAVQGKKIWVAFLESSGNWFIRDSSNQSAAWKPPFVARWRVDLMKEGGFAESKAYKAELLAETVKDALVVYPLERDSATPLLEFCMRDIMKATLGVGPCEYVIQAEKLVNDATPHQVAVWVGQQFEKGKDKAQADEIKKKLGQMVEHVKSAQDRIDGYGELAGRIAALLKGPGAAKPELAGYVKSLQTTVEIIEKTVKGGGTAVLRMAQTKSLADNGIALIGKENGTAEFKKLADEMSVIGEAQDKEISICRMAARWIKQQAKMMSTASGDAKLLGAKIMAEAGATLGGGK